MAETATDDDLFWVDPDRRGILPLDTFHISRSLAKRMRRGNITACLNRDFQATVSACADRDETWINPTLLSLYAQIHDWNAAHALEVWDGQTCLGGVFGLSIGRAFFGESMYSTQPNGSKIALAFLTAHLSRCGFTLFDTQFITDHLLTLGAREISRDEYHERLEAALTARADITSHPLPTVQDVLHRNTQTS